MLSISVTGSSVFTFLSFFGIKSPLFQAQSCDLRPQLIGLFFYGTDREDAGTGVIAADVGNDSSLLIFIDLIDLVGEYDGCILQLAGDKVRHGTFHFVPSFTVDKRNDSRIPAAGISEGAADAVGICHPS